MQAAFESVDRAIVGLAAEVRSTGEVGSGMAAMSRATSRRPAELDLLASDEWPGVPSGAILLAPDKCRSLWRQFFSESARAVQQAVAVQVAAPARLHPLLLCTGQWGLL